MQIQPNTSYLHCKANLEKRNKKSSTAQLAKSHTNGQESGAAVDSAAEASVAPSYDGENLKEDVADQAESTNLEKAPAMGINHREPEEDDYEVFDTDGKSALSDAYEDTSIIGQRTRDLVHFSSLPIHVSKLAKKKKRPRPKFNFTGGCKFSNKSREGLRTITISSPSNFVHVASVTKQPKDNAQETVAGDKSDVDESSTKYSVIVIKSNEESENNEADVRIQGE